MPITSPISGADLGDAVDSVAHIVQVALTPVFLLSGIGTLLNLFNTRLSRVSDQREHVDELLHSDPDEAEGARMHAHLRRLQRRTTMLDASIILGGIGGASTCGAAFVLFLGSLRNTVIATWLFILLGLALGCTAFALVAFLADSVLAWHGLHREGSLPRPK
jgi:ABC-type nickel/cobalt efflux system permease component RcnA